MKNSRSSHKCCDRVPKTLASNFLSLGVTELFGRGKGSLVNVSEKRTHGNDKRSWQVVGEMSMEGSYDKDVANRS